MCCYLIPLLHLNNYSKWPWGRILLFSLYYHTNVYNGNVNINVHLFCEYYERIESLTISNDSLYKLLNKNDRINVIRLFENDVVCCSIRQYTVFKWTYWFSLFCFYRCVFALYNLVVHKLRQSFSQEYD